MENTDKKTNGIRTFMLKNLTPAMRWALLSCLTVALGFGIVNFFILFRPYGFLPTLITGVGFLFTVLALAIVLTMLLAAFKRLRWQTFFVIIASTLLSILLFGLLIYVFPLLIFITLTVYLTIMCITKQYKALSIPQKILRYGLLSISGLVAIALSIIILWPGPSLSRPNEASLALPYAENIHAPDIVPLSNPSALGDYSFTIHYYASIEQRNEPFPGQNTIVSSSADASVFLDSWGNIRRRQLGFGSDTLPLNARVWMPEGDGVFPIALIVHGNHDAGVRSYEGYDYLGELLASRGIIAVSADQTFLNISPVYDALMLDALQDEVGARAFVLLEHLMQWYNWNNDPSHDFYSKVDFERIALIGHSRGGEAVALAASFADLGHYPGNGQVVFDYPFSINTVIALAPTHRMYDPSGAELSLSGINYLVIHGGHDMDFASFEGEDMYHRVDVSDRGIKAKVWIQHANHGQFNSIWGRNDLMGLWNMTTNRRLLISVEEQQVATKVFVSAFLEATLHGRQEYTSLFRYFANGAEWLPPTWYITDFADSNMVLLDSFDYGFNLGVSTSGLVTYSSHGFDGWTITELPTKRDSSNRVLRLQWGSTEHLQDFDVHKPVFRTEFAQGTVFVGDSLFMSLSSGNESADDPNISFQIKLTDSEGNTSTMHINDFGGVVNPVDAPVYTPIYLSLIGRSEPVLHMVRIPTEQFGGLQGEIIGMEWIMDIANIGGTGQVLFVDDLRVERR
ncbi:MAG: hypothetical protein FWE32_09710 [Oscillospiraceae bacterium]|nr:hypothetical protein [Oscillospiraceae bacterium]